MQHAVGKREPTADEIERGCMALVRVESLLLRCGCGKVSRHVQAVLCNILERLASVLTTTTTVLKMWRLGVTEELGAIDVRRTLDDLAAWAVGLLLTHRRIVRTLLLIMPFITANEMDLCQPLSSFATRVHWDHHGNIQQWEKSDTHSWELRICSASDLSYST